MKTLKQIMEDGAAVAGPTCSAGSGAVAGIGQPAGSRQAEPGVPPKNKKSRLLLDMGRRNKS